MAKKNISAQVTKAVTELFYRNGIEKTGVDTICAKAKVAKMSMYKYFGSKDGLILHYLDLQTEKFVAESSAAMQSANFPKGKILALFDKAKNDFNSPKYRGCPLQNAALEIADSNHSGHAIILEGKDLVRQAIITNLRNLGANAEQAEEASFNIQSTLEGAIILSGMHNFPEALTRARRAAEAIINSVSS